MIILQPASHTDRITEDGTELTQRPYPFYVSEDGSGRVGNQKLRVLGFQKNLARHRIDLHWVDAVKDPQQAVGMYIVTQDAGGGMAVHIAAIETVRVETSS